MPGFLSASASITILNPWFELEPRVTFVGPNAPAEQEPRIITPHVRVPLPEQDIELFFRFDEVVFASPTGSSDVGYLVNPIRYFLAFRSFVNYNVIGYPSEPVSEADFEEDEVIRFHLQKVELVTRQIETPDGPVEASHHDFIDNVLGLQSESIAKYLAILNETLYYSLAFYLIGCENRRYFLVEFYKAVEAIKNSFGSDQAFLDSLRPFGISRAGLSDFRGICNDVRDAPLDIGRHAPAPGVPLYNIDLRNLLVEPRSRDVFVTSTKFVRKVVDCYMSYLGDNPV